ncbi:hypothetical protein [Brevibacillus sp. H7]|uniref:hypothetical protein n=1 Tax=Brevibacillus sp. H7 TaxID=3349138 RepID=UPI0038266BFB
MLDVLLQHLDEFLSRHGVITNVVLRTERSLLEEEEGTREVALYFAASEEELDKPVATLHLFPLDEQNTFELEVEIEFARNDEEEVNQLWLASQKIVPEVSLTEKKRYLSPGRLAESSIILDYHFLLDLPKANQDEQVLRQTLERFAADLGKLIRL